MTTDESASESIVNYREKLLMQTKFAADQYILLHFPSCFAY